MLAISRGLVAVGARSGAALKLELFGPTLDPRVTFSRASNATLTNSQGQIAYAPHNLLTYSEQFDNAIWNKVAGTVTANATTAPDGTTTADAFIENTATANHNIYYLTSLAVSTYTYSFFAKANGRTQVQVEQESGGNSRFTLTGAGTAVALGANTVSIQSVGNGWYRCSTTFTSTGTFGIYTILYNGATSYTGDGTSGVFLWGAQLNIGPLQPYYVTTASAYQGPRFDYDPVSLAARGLLIEEQRTNLLTYSEQFDNAAWAKADVTVTANAVVAPDGTLSADTVIPNATNTGTHRIFQNATLTATAYTYSVYAKAAGYNFLVLQTDLSGYVEFNLSTGVVSATSGVNYTASITSVGSGWYRCAITFTGTAASYAMYNYVYPATGVASFSGNGTSGIYLWGAQLEAGAFATSYIPTAAAQVTRAADIASMTGTNLSSWFNATEGTLFAEATPSQAPATEGIVRFMAAFYDGLSYTNALRYERTAGNFRVVQTVAGVSNTFGASWATGTLGKTVGAYAASNSAGAFNGGTAGAISGSVPTGITEFGIGGNNGGSNSWCGHIRRISYYRRRLSNAELQALTA